MVKQKSGKLPKGILLVGGFGKHKSSNPLHERNLPSKSLVQALFKVIGASSLYVSLMHVRATKNEIQQGRASAKAITFDKTCCREDDQRSVLL